MCTPIYVQLVLLCSVCNIWLLSLYGTYGKEHVLDVVAAVIVMFYAVEITLKVYAYGIQEFWNYARFNSPNKVSSLLS